MTLWTRLDRLVDRAPDLASLRVHKLHLLAARRWRSGDRPVPPDLLAEERAAAVATLAAPFILERARAVIDGPVLLLKGPEIGARFPDPALRPFGDLDLLVADPDAAYAALVRAGCVTVATIDYASHHHHQPLVWPGSPLQVEVHRSLPWHGTLPPPSFGDLRAAAIPATVGGPGVLTLPPAEHAVLLAVHAWSHAPLRRILDLVDVALMADGVDPRALDAVARRWGVLSIWDQTTRATTALLGAQGDDRWPLRLWWARHLPAARQRTVAEYHVARWRGAMTAATHAGKVGDVLGAVWQDVRPKPGERWPARLTRIVGDVRHAFAPAVHRHDS